jgi:DNA topoisomerase-3
MLSEKNGSELSSMKVVLAEKPSVARDIAKVLNVTSKKNGYIEGNGWAVTWAFGHLVELKDPEQYDKSQKQWRLENLPIIPDKFKLRTKSDKSSQEQLKTIKKLFEQAEEIVCATDAGREGELIFRYIQSWSKTEKKPFKRLWISSLTSEAIKNGFANLKEGNVFDDLYKAAKCRSESDWIVGINATRFFTVKYGHRGRLWSVGRVQTPVLAMIVKRDQDIRNFKPEDFFEIHTIYRNVRFKHQGAKILQKEKADKLFEKIKEPEFVVKDIKEKKEKVNPPLLFDLTELQREMNKVYGFTANDTLKLAQNLYESKHITYPRTDSRYLTKDLVSTLPALLNKLKAIRGTEIAEIDLKKLNVGKRMINDAKVTDHHAIIPTNMLPLRISGDERKLYDAIVTRFIAAFYPPCVKSVTTVTANVVKEKFKATGTVILDPGWQKLYNTLSTETDVSKKNSKSKSDEQQIMPQFEKGESGPHKPEVKTLKTSPPKHFTESSLLRMMETAGRMVDDESLKEALKNKGIGTPATRASIIEVLIKRGFVSRRKKNLLATDVGEQLISMIKDDRLKSPELTGEWEANLKLMEEGKYDSKKFMDDIVAHTKSIIDKTSEERGSNEIGACPKCKAQIIEGQRGFGCSNWKDGCDFVLWKNLFGSTIGRDEASGILTSGVSWKPILLFVDEVRFYGKIRMSSDGEFSWERLSNEESPNIKSPVGKCPVCNGAIVESKKAYGCSNWQSGCKFVIWKKIAKKTISKALATELLRDGEISVQKGFKSKAGKEFSAGLKIVNSQVKFVFS